MKLIITDDMVSEPPNEPEAPSMAEYEAKSYYKGDIRKVDSLALRHFNPKY